MMELTPELAEFVAYVSVLNGATCCIFTLVGSFIAHLFVRSFDKFLDKTLGKFLEKRKKRE